MKPTIFLLACLVIISCKKQTEAPGETDAEHIIYFREIGTQVPIQDAWIELYKCSQISITGVCSSVVFNKATSASSGECRYRTFNTRVDHVVVGHSKYWSQNNGGWNGTYIPTSGEIFLVPKTTIVISVNKKNKNIARQLNIGIGDSVSLYTLLAQQLNVQVRSDTMLYANGYGNISTLVSWSADTSHALLSFRAQRFDTTRISINID